MHLLSINNAQVILLSTAHLFLKQHNTALNWPFGETYAWNIKEERLILNQNESWSKTRTVLNGLHYPLKKNINPCLQDFSSLSPKKGIAYLTAGFAKMLEFRVVEQSNNKKNVINFNKICVLLVRASVSLQSLWLECAQFSELILTQLFRLKLPDCRSLGLSKYRNHCGGPSHNQMVPRCQVDHSNRLLSRPTGAL